MYYIIKLNFQLLSPNKYPIYCNIRAKLAKTHPIFKPFHRLGYASAYHTLLFVQFAENAVPLVFRQSAQQLLCVAPARLVIFIQIKHHIRNEAFQHGFVISFLKCILALVVLVFASGELKGLERLAIHPHTHLEHIMPASSTQLFLLSYIFGVEHELMSAHLKFNPIFHTSKICLLPIPFQFPCQTCGNPSHFQTISSVGVRICVLVSRNTLPKGNRP